MSTLTRIMKVALILSAAAVLGAAAEVPATAPELELELEPARQWVWLESQGVWGYGYQIQAGAERGLWRIDPGSKRAPLPADPYGFADVLNRTRMSMGLPPAVYDPELSS